jgi:hypothetical protein
MEIEVIPRLADIWRFLSSLGFCAVSSAHLSSHLETLNSMVSTQGLIDVLLL